MNSNMNAGTYMVPITVTEEQKKYISQLYPGKELPETLSLFITQCIKDKTSVHSPSPDGKLK